MPRIAGVDVPPKKRGEIALTSIYGVGRSLAREILGRVDLDPNMHPDDWTEEQTKKVRRLVEDNYVVEGQLRTFMGRFCFSIQQTTQKQARTSRRGVRCT